MELLAPAGDFNKLRLAIKYGADAVYLGGKFGLRAGAAMSDEALAQAVLYAHNLGKKVYVTVNIFARNDDFFGIKTYLKWLETIKVDAVIVSDLGVLRLARDSTKLDVHISTQANVLNKFTAMEYVQMGASRIILARECSLPEIKEIADYLDGKCDIEVFVHGAMCVSYSGRCLLSNYTTGREANRGECAHPCRWKYSLMEEQRPNDFFPIEADAHGTYIMNSRDLCLIEHLDELKNAGVTSYKIEGRMKSEYYVAAAINAYRRAMNGEKFDLMSEVDKCAHRPWTKGFMFGETNLQFTEHGSPISAYEVVAYCPGSEKIYQRNVICVGDKLEILSYGENNNKTFTVTNIRDQDGNKIERANKAGGVYFIDCPYELQEDEFLRKQV